VRNSGDTEGVDVVRYWRVTV